MAELPTVMTVTDRLVGEHWRAGHKRLLIGLSISLVEHHPGIFITGSWMTTTRSCLNDNVGAAGTNSSASVSPSRCEHCRYIDVGSTADSVNFSPSLHNVIQKLIDSGQ